MIFYHRTDAWNSISANGFRDGHGSYGFATERSGVFVSDEPAEVGEGATGDQLLRLDIPGSEAVYEKYEWVQDGTYTREWCIPASVLNETASVALMSEAEEEALADRLWEERLLDRSRNHPDPAVRAFNATALARIVSLSMPAAE